MKYVIFFLCILSAVSSCRKNDGPVNNGPDGPVDTLPQQPKDTHLVPLGTVSVRKNGAVWNANFISGYFHSDSAFSLIGKQQANGLRQTLGILDIPTKIGKHIFELWPSGGLFPNQKPEVGLALVYDGDQGLGGYDLDTTRTDHYIEVLHYDSIAHTVEGRFQVFLRMYDPPSWIPPGIVLPEYAAMTEGKYYLKLE